MAASELPPPKPGKALPEREVVMLVLRDTEGRVLLQRRPSTGVWASLWSLPEHAGIDAAWPWFQRHAHGDLGDALEGDTVRHGFSHYRLRIVPLHLGDVRPRDAVGDNPDLRWATRADLAGIGLPAPVRRLLEKD